MLVPVSGARSTRTEFLLRTALDRGGKAHRLKPTRDLRTDFAPWLMSIPSALRYSARFMATRSTTSFGPMRCHLAFLTRNFSTYSVNVFGERRLTEFPEGAVTSRTFPSFNLSGHSRQVKDWPVYLSFETSVEGLSRSDTLSLHAARGSTV